MDGTIDRLRQLRAIDRVPTLTLTRSPRELGQVLEHDRLEQLIRERQAERLARIAKAKAEAPATKEPLDLDFVKRSARTGALGQLSDEELAVKLEDLYYVDHPSYRTNRELVELIAQLAAFD